MPDTLSPSPNEVLIALLSAHGYEATISAERVVVKGYEAQFSSEVFLRPETVPSQLQLDVRVHLPDERTLIESFSGVGKSPKYALGDSFDNFSRSSFHVLLQAFFNDLHRHDSNEESNEKWQLPSGHFNVWIGDATFRGQPPVSGEELVRWFEPFAHFVQQTPLSPHQSHWVRLYYAQHKGKTMVCEVLLDNETWQELQHKMIGFPWPQGEDFYSARLFLVLQPAP